MANKAEIWYECSLNGANYRDLPAPDRLPGPRTWRFNLFPVKPVTVKKATDKTLLLHNGKRPAKESSDCRYEPGVSEALFTADRAIRRYMADYERNVMRDYAEDMYASILSGDVSRQRALVSTVSRKVAEERARFNGWRASVEAFIEHAVSARDEGRTNG